MIIQNIIFYIIYVAILAPLPYVSFRKKYYKIFWTLTISSFSGLILAFIDPPYNSDTLAGLLLTLGLLGVVFPIYTIGVISYIVIVVADLVKKEEIHRENKSGLV